MATDAATAPIRRAIPARLDRLPWSTFHTRMVIGLGSAWALDGLQITIASWSFVVAGRRPNPASMTLPGSRAR